MCGIYFKLRKRATPDNERYDHQHLHDRGPDEVQLVNTADYFAAFHRLAIVGVKDGMQPFIDGDIVLLCNGEIYNYMELLARHSIIPKTSSDCEVILHLYRKYGIHFAVTQLLGEFAFILYDAKDKSLYFARDIYGRKPLFFSFSSDDKICVSSLYKCIDYREGDGRQVIPRNIYHYKAGAGLFVMNYFTHVVRYDLSITPDILMKKFSNAVRCRVHQSERPVGFLLSGGFDSSLVLSVALDLFPGLRKVGVDAFTIGFHENAPDVKSAALMVDWLRAKYGNECIRWHKHILPIEEGIKAIPQVVRCLETYDTTTIRASVPMYLISRYIAMETKVRVILSGEGSDELFGGYLYFKFAPNELQRKAEIIKLLDRLYLYDCLRADRTTADWGLEIRTPFLDEEFTTCALNYYEGVPPSDIPPSQNTKALIRYVVDKQPVRYLPDEILHGKKEAFSDAVGLSWKEAITEYCSKMEFKKNEPATDKYPVSPDITPETPEMRYFQSLFSREFGQDLHTWRLLEELWLPNQSWVRTGVEPSARVLSVYKGGLYPPLTPE
jgi:asparagine synthase (glutamine-hydrolysing)